jgi:hypothetical protein
MLLALVITRLLGDGQGIGTARYLLAGAVLGLSPTVKIWAVAAVLVVVITIMVRRGRRPGLLTLAGSLASCTMVCAPFFVLAPRQMWQMVVVAQLARRRVDTELPTRVGDILGTREWTTRHDQSSVLLIIALLTVLASLVCCLARAELRVVAIMMITDAALVLSAPMWYLHYAGLTAAPLALTIGGAVGAMMRWTKSVRWPPAACAGLVSAMLLIFAWPLHDVTLGHRRLPTAALGSALAGRAGCLTTDYPMTLVLLDQLQHQIDRDCPYVVDLGGYSYYDTAGSYHLVSRRKNPDWQRLAMGYFRSGDAVIIVRFSTERGLSRATAKELDNWPVIVRSGRYVVRQPMVAPKTSPSR